MKKYAFLDHVVRQKMKKIRFCLESNTPSRNFRLAALQKVLSIKYQDCKLGH